MSQKMVRVNEHREKRNNRTGKNVSTKTNNESREVAVLKCFSDVHQVMVFSFNCHGCTYLFTRSKHSLLYEFPVSEEKLHSNAFSYS